jgi:hypothetical protein
METVNKRDCKYWVQDVNKIPMKVFEARYNELTFGLPFEACDEYDREVFNTALNQLRRERQAQLN